MRLDRRHEITVLRTITRSGLRGRSEVQEGSLRSSCRHDRTDRSVGLIPRDVAPPAGGGEGVRYLLVQSAPSLLCHPPVEWRDVSIWGRVGASWRPRPRPRMLASTSRPPHWSVCEEDRSPIFWSRKLVFGSGKWRMILLNRINLIPEQIHK